jgi:hypothetical protein
MLNMINNVGLGKLYFLSFVLFIFCHNPIVVAVVMLVFFVAIALRNNSATDQASTPKEVFGLACIGVSTILSVMPAFIFAIGIDSNERRYQIEQAAASSGYQVQDIQTALAILGKPDFVLFQTDLGFLCFVVFWILTICLFCKIYNACRKALLIKRENKPHTDNVE